MRRLTVRLRLCPILACVAAATPAAADPPPPGPPPAVPPAADRPLTSSPADRLRAASDVSQLIHQLSAPDYHRREQAAASLLLIGPAALPAVRVAAEGPDPELRLRAGRLLVELERQALEERITAFVDDHSGRAGATLPGWDAFRAAVGPRDVSRHTFTQLYRADPAFFENVFSPSDPGGQAPIKTLVERRLAKLHSLAIRRRSTRPGDAWLRPHLLATLTVAAARPDSLNKRGTQLMTQLARAELSRVANADGPQAFATRRLLASWIVGTQTDDLYVLGQMLQLADRLQLHDTVPLAVAIATGKHQVRPAHARFRARALMLVGKLGDRRDAARLEPLLRDPAVCAAAVPGDGDEPSRLGVEIRDVALAVLLHLEGQDPGLAGFDRLVPSDDRLFDLQSLAFSTPQQRDEAIAAWQGAAAGPVRVAGRPSGRLAR